MAQVSARYARLIEICRTRGCPREDAKDLVQEAHLRLFEYQRSAAVKDVDSLLRRIVVNLSINYFHRTLSTPYSFESLVEVERREPLVDTAPGPEQDVAAQQELDIAFAALSAVSDRMRRIFIAQRIGYSYEEIGTAFGIMPRTVERHVASASSALKQAMSME